MKIVRKVECLSSVVLGLALAACGGRPHVEAVPYKGGAAPKSAAAPTTPTGVQTAVVPPGASDLAAPKGTQVDTLVSSQRAITSMSADEIQAELSSSETKLAMSEPYTLIYYSTSLDNSKRLASLRTLFSIRDHASIHCKDIKAIFLIDPNFEPQFLGTDGKGSLRSDARPEINGNVANIPSNAKAADMEAYLKTLPAIKGDVCL